MPKPAPGRDFYIATADEIRAGRTTDIYCVWTRRAVMPVAVSLMYRSTAHLILRSVTIGGLDATTTPLWADLLGVPAIRTMPPALAIVMCGPRDAFAAVHKYLQAKIPRIAL